MYIVQGCRDICKLSILTVWGKIMMKGEKGEKYIFSKVLEGEGKYHFGKGGGGGIYDF